MNASLVLLLVLSDCLCYCWCDHRDTATAFKDDEERDQDIFGPIRDLMSASEAEVRCNKRLREARREYCHPAPYSHHS
jgi:hypothetical protein